MIIFILHELIPTFFVDLIATFFVTAIVYPEKMIIKATVDYSSLLAPIELK